MKLIYVQAWSSKNEIKLRLFFRACATIPLAKLVIKLAINSRVMLQNCMKRQTQRVKKDIVLIFFFYIYIYLIILYN